MEQPIIWYFDCCYPNEILLGIAGIPLCEIISTGDDFNSRSTPLKSIMAKKSVVARSKKKPKYSSRIVRRCFRCGRVHGYMRDFDLCRICFRELANEGKIPGIKKSSW